MTQSIILEEFSERQLAFHDGGGAFQALLAQLDEVELKEYPHPAKRVRGIDSRRPALVRPPGLGRCE